MECNMIYQLKIPLGFFYSVETIFKDGIIIFFYDLPIFSGWT
jgi:hypothetical protein